MDELVKELRDSAEWADRLALLTGRAEGDVHAPVMRKAADAIEELQKRTVKGNCKICARNSTVLNNNTTRCPLEEHFALPDDGYCYLYEPPKEKVFGQYTDTAGKFHWCGTHSGEHTIKTEDGET